MVKVLRAWWWALKMKWSTEREIELGQKLAAAKQDAATWEDHYKTLQGDFAALFDDYKALQAAYAARLEYSKVMDVREEDWSAYPFGGPIAKWVTCSKCSHRFGQISLPDGGFADVDPCEHARLPGSVFYVQAPEVAQ